MAFVSNMLNFPNLTSKASPVGADLIMIADSAASNAVKQATISSILAASTSGGLVFLGTGTASNSTSVDFPNFLSSTYDNYLVMVENYQPVSTSTILTLLVGTGAGPTYQVSNYTGSSASYVAIATGTTTSLLTGAGSVNIYDANTSNIKHIHVISSVFAAATAVNLVQWSLGTVLTSVRLINNTGNISTGTFKLYGYKN